VRVKGKRVGKWGGVTRRKPPTGVGPIAVGKVCGQSRGVGGADVNRGKGDGKGKKFEKGRRGYWPGGVGGGVAGRRGQRQRRGKGEPKQRGRGRGEV